MAVATSSRRAIAEEYLINANVYKFLMCWCVAMRLNRGNLIQKFYQCSRKINLSPAQCLMFEDSENGLRSAYDAGGMTVLLKILKRRMNRCWHKPSIIMKRWKIF